jgi:hypothetical protein
MERNENCSRFESRVFPEGHPRAEANLAYVERLIKFLLWQRGGYRIHIGGPRSIGEYIQKIYSAEGMRRSDYHFMGEQVYERAYRSPQIQQKYHHARAVTTGATDGCRIGFDLGHLTAR